MKKTRMIPCILALVLIFGIYGAAFAGGGGPDPAACDAAWECFGGPPPADAGKFLRGDYTVSNVGGEFVVHVRLKWGVQEQMYSFTTSYSQPLCDYTVDQLKTTFATKACQLIGTDLANPDFTGLLKHPDTQIAIPVLTDLTIEKKYFCDKDFAMIRGEIVVRVVPVDLELISPCF